MTETKNTLFVNLYGGPGTGKSTYAAGVFHHLKLGGVNSEYIQEYAKDATWREDYATLMCQPYITGKQLFRQYRVNSKIHIAVTDSPLLNGLAYGGFGVTPSYSKWLIEAYGLFRNLNIFLKRDTIKHPYNQAGRTQTEEDAIAIDRKILYLLESNNIPFTEIIIGENTVQDIIKLIRKEYD